VKCIWIDTHINTFDYYVCGAEGPTPNSYDDFVNVLNATQNFSVDGRQFRVWLEVAPGSEAIEDGCQVPHDHPLTHFNETSLFNASVGCEYAAQTAPVSLKYYVCAAAAAMPRFGTL
jgi:hypothetical protein